MKKQYLNLLTWIADRLKEPSTYHGINVLLVAFGVTLAPDKTQFMITVGSMLSGLILIATKENK